MIFLTVERGMIRIWLSLHFTIASPSLLIVHLRAKITSPSWSVIVTGISLFVFFISVAVYKIQEIKNIENNNIDLPKNEVFEVHIIDIKAISIYNRTILNLTTSFS